MTDLTGRICYVNRAFLSRVGMCEEQLIGKTLSDIGVIEAEQLNTIDRKVMPQLLAEDTVREVETLALNPDGSQSTVLVNLTLLRDEAGEPSHVVAVVPNAAGLKEAERALIDSEQRYRTLVESAGEAIAMVDENGEFHFMNNTAAQRLGGKPADFVGRTMWELFPSDVADRQIGSIRQVIRSGQGSNTVSLSYVGGEMRWYNTTIEPVRDGDGKIVAGLIIARDIHEFKKAQDELAAYGERMIRAEQLASLGTLSATLSHELTQPLTVIRLSIQNSLEDLKKSTSCPERVLEDLKDGLAEIASVTAIAERFRSFARRSSEKVPREICVHDTAGKVMQLLHESARRSNVAVEIHGLDTLPPVCMYERDLEQLIFALAQNAIQAADGRTMRRFAIGGCHAGDHVELQFADDCGGIAPENLECVFDPFFTTKPPGEGTGLGLCIAQRVVCQARGRMSVESDFGQGTTFRVSLPVQGA